MSVVNIPIGSHTHQIACDDGQEKHLLSLAQQIDQQYSQLAKNMPNASQSTLLLLTALTLQDELGELKSISEKAKNTSPTAETIAKNKRIACDLAVSEVLNVVSEHLETIAKSQKKS